MATQSPAHEPITGGCLCGQVRYTISFPTADSWPPSSHCCQCTQCRKALGSLIAPFLNLPPSNLTWSRPSLPLDSEDPIPPSPFKEFTSSPGVRRGFCGNCGSTMSFRHENSAQEIEICTGTVDEKWLIGNRTERVSSEDLAKEGKLEEVCKEEGGLGKAIAEPRAGYFFWRNAIAGVTDHTTANAKRWVEHTAKGLQIPD